jgi:hypothetical protein
MALLGNCRIGPDGLLRSRGTGRPDLKAGCRSLGFTRLPLT